MVSLVLALVAVLSVISVSAVPVSIDEVEVNGEEMIEDVDNRLDIQRGEEIEVKVRLNALADGEDLEVEAFISGFEHNDRTRLSDISDVFDVEADTTYIKKLRFDLSELVDEDDYLLRVIISDRNSDALIENYMLKIDVPRRDLTIRDVVFNPDNTVQAGRALLATVRIRNSGEQDEDDGVKVTVSIPELGVSASDFIDEVESDESTTSEELFLRIPVCAPAGVYTARITAEYNEGFDEVSTTKSISVVESGACEINAQATGGKTTITFSGGSQDLVAGAGGAAYPIALTNGGNVDRTFTLSVDGVSSWGTVRITPSNVVTVGAGETQNAFVFVSASDDAAAGERTFVVSVKDASGNALRDLALKANVVDDGNSDFGDARRVLEVGLVLLVVLLVLIGLVVAFRRVRGDEGEESQTYY